MQARDLIRLIEAIQQAADNPEIEIGFYDDTRTGSPLLQRIAWWNELPPHESPQQFLNGRMDKAHIGLWTAAD